MERLRAEVLEHCGPRKPATYEGIKDLKYSTFPDPNCVRAAQLTA